MKELPLRVISKISPEPNTGCWLWIGQLSNEGYARITYKRKHWKAHRLVYELMRGCIPVGLQLDHLCRVRCCVNPQHLEPVTNRENSRRSPLIGKTLKTHCKSGHEYTADNTRLRPNGWRRCRACEEMKRQQDRLTNRSHKRSQTQTDLKENTIR